METKFKKDRLFNFDIKTYFLIQKIASITFLFYMYSIFGLKYGSYQGIPLKITLFVMISFVAMLFAQSYVHGAYLSLRVTTISIPLAVFLVCALLDFLMSYLLTRIEYHPYWESLAIFYGYGILQFGILLITYNQVEYREVSVDEVDRLLSGDVERIETISQKEKNSFY